MAIVWLFVAVLGCAEEGVHCGEADWGGIQIEADCGGGQEADYGGEQEEADCGGGQVEIECGCGGRRGADSGGWWEADCGAR